MPTKLLLWHRQVYNIPENEVNEKLCTAAGVVRTTAQARGQFENATTIVNESVGRGIGTSHKEHRVPSHGAPQQTSVVFADWLRSRLCRGDAFCPDSNGKWRLH